MRYIKIVDGKPIESNADEYFNWLVKTVRKNKK